MRSNLLAGLASSVWSAVIGIAVVPLYLRLLGLEAYGLIGLLASMQALFSLLDLGLAPAINREVAKARSVGDIRPARELLHTLSFVYWGTAVVIAIAGAALGPVIGRHWLQSQHLSANTVGTSLQLMAVVVACRWPIGLYLGTLVGSERVVLVSYISIAMTTITSVGAVALLSWGPPKIELFFIWQAFAGILNALAMRAAAWHVIGRSPGLSFSTVSLRRIWRFSAGLSGIAVSALLLTQVDKIVLSRSLTLAAFGEYSLATLVVASLYLLISPTFNVAYPRFTTLVATGSVQRLGEDFRWGTRVFATALSALSMLLAVFAKDLVGVWTGNSVLAINVAPVIGFLAVSVALHGVMFLLYALQLAHGMTRLPLTINLVLVAIAVPLMALLAWRYGSIGGALAWLLLYSLYVCLGTWLTHRKLPGLVTAAWLVRDVCAPLAIASVTGVVGLVLMTTSPWSLQTKWALALGLLGVHLAASIATAPRSTMPRLMGYFGASKS